MLRSRGVYSVLVVKALAAAEPRGAKGEGGSLASFFKCTDNQSIPRVGHFRSKWHLNGTYLGNSNYAIKTYLFQNEEMVTVPWMDPNGDPSFSFRKP